MCTHFYHHAQFNMYSKISDEISLKNHDKHLSYIASLNSSVTPKITFQAIYSW